MAGPGSRDTSLEKRGTKFTPQLDLASVPQSLVDHMDDPTTKLRHRVDVHHDPVPAAADR